MSFIRFDALFNTFFCVDSRVVYTRYRNEMIFLFVFIERKIEKKIHGKFSDKSSWTWMISLYQWVCSMPIIQRIKINNGEWCFFQMFDMCEWKVSRIFPPHHRHYDRCISLASCVWKISIDCEKNSTKSIKWKQSRKNDCWHTFSRLFPRHEQGSSIFQKCLF